MVSIVFLGIWWIALLGPWPRRPIIRWFYGGILLILLLWTGVATLGNYYNDWYPLRTVQMATKLRLGPDEQYGNCCAVAQGDQVRVMKQVAEWCCVKHDTTMGWMPQVYLTKKETVD